MRSSSRRGIPLRHAHRVAYSARRTLLAARGVSPDAALGLFLVDAHSTPDHIANQARVLADVARNFVSAIKPTVATGLGLVPRESPADGT